MIIPVFRFGNIAHILNLNWTFPLLLCEEIIELILCADAAGAYIAQAGQRRRRRFSRRAAQSIQRRIALHHAVVIDSIWCIVAEHDFLLRAIFQRNGHNRYRGLQPKFRQIHIARILVD